MSGASLGAKCRGIAVREGGRDTATVTRTSIPGLLLTRWVSSFRQHNRIRVATVTRGRGNGTAGKVTRVPTASTACGY